jgi:hypothetical protein
VQQLNKGHTAGSNPANILRKESFGVYEDTPMAGKNSTHFAYYVEPLPKYLQLCVVNVEGCLVEVK